MTKVIQADLIEYCGCRYGRSLAEAAGHFECSIKTIQRKLDAIEQQYPGFVIERIHREDNVMRVRIVARSKLSFSLVGRDVLTLHALRSMEELAKCAGLESTADKLGSIYESILRNVPYATRRSVEVEVNKLLAAEVYAFPPVQRDTATPAPAMRGGLLDRLRLAVTTGRIVRLVVSDNISVVAGVTGLQYGLEADVRVDLRTPQGETMVLSLSAIEDVVGIDDLVLQSVAA
jgi:hypothetical protein